MTKKGLMQKSENHTVMIVKSDGTQSKGYVALYESEFENEYDDIPEASISLFIGSGDGELLYERDIEGIEILLRKKR